MAFNDSSDNIERIAQGLEDRADVSANYDHVLWETARKNKLEQLFESGQTRLTSFDFNICYNGSGTPIKSPEPSKSVQTRFTTKGGELNMESVDSLDVDVQDRPKNETKEAEVVEINKGERQDFFEPNDDGEYEYGHPEDPYVQLVCEYTHEGVELEHTEAIRFYSSPDSRSNLAKIQQRYGDIQKGLEVNVDFDSDGFGDIVIPR